jgi:acyl-CoA reductase-like NAD-dependent aldehyde dehydrogenase
LSSLALLDSAMTTPVEEVPKIVARVASKSNEWKSLPLENKIQLLKQVLRNTIQFHDEWTSLSLQDRGISATDPRHGCARADVITCSQATLGSYLHGLLSCLEYCAKHEGMPPPPKSTRILENKKCAVTVWPSTLLDKLEAVGLTGELILTDNAQCSLQETSVGGIAGILGAGNFNAPIEVLCEMFLRARVCIYKPNPVNAKQFDAVQNIFKPLVDAGYLAIVFGGANVGTALVQDSALNQVVLTGSAATYDKIQPLTTRPICAELGGVNPWIVVPSKGWNQRSIDRHARHLAFSKLANNGHTCAAPQVVVVAKDWEYRQAFLDRVRYWLGEYAGNAPFYPGSDTIHSDFASLPNAQVIGGDTSVFEKQQHPILIPNVDADEESQNDVFTREAFCPVLAEVPIDSPSDNALSFLQTATKFVSNKCVGSLTCNILIPDVEVKTMHGFDDLIADLPFGVVGVNVWPAFAHSMPILLWGAPPGHVQSGTGFIGNAGLYKNPQKAVLRAPFHWLGLRALSVMPPLKTEKVFQRLASYKLRPNMVTQSMLFAAIFLGI